MLVRETAQVALPGDRRRSARASPINEIGRAIENHARKHNLGVVREFIGHGIGEEFHGALQIPHYYDSRARTVLEAGMTFTIEPMLTSAIRRSVCGTTTGPRSPLDGRRTRAVRAHVGGHRRRLRGAHGVARATVADDR